MINWLFKKYINKKVDELVQIRIPALTEDLKAELRPVLIKEIEDQRKPDWKEKCEWLFYNEVDGKNYYKYTSFDHTHIQRFERSSANMILLGNRLNHNELEKLAEIGKTAIEKMMNVLQKENRIKHAEKALWVFQEMEMRREALMFHPDIMLDLMATNIIREDEDPKTINMDIHNQKIAMFKTKGGEIPFLIEASLKDYLPEWKKLLNAIKTTWEMHQEQVKISATAYQKIHTELQSEIT